MTETTDTATAPVADRGKCVSGLVLGIVGASLAFLAGMAWMAPPHGEFWEWLGSMFLVAPVAITGLCLSLSGRGKRYATAGWVLAASALAWMAMALAVDTAALRAEENAEPPDYNALYWKHEGYSGPFECLPEFDRVKEMGKFSSPYSPEYEALLRCEKRHGWKLR